MLVISRAVRINRVRSRLVSRTSLARETKLLTTEAVPEGETPNNGDCLVSALNSAQDIMVRAVSCRETVQESILRNDLSQNAGQKLAEVMASTLLMGAGLKANETLQVNLVGGDPNRIRNVMVVTDGDLSVRGLVGNPRFSVGTKKGRGGEFPTMEVFGEGGQVQVVRNHPEFKKPQVGIVKMRDADVSLNLALYLQESEQRTAAIITDVFVEGNLCRHALGVIVERLPGVTDDNIETSISNLGELESKGLRSYLTRTPEELEAAEKADTSGEMFRDFEPVLERMLDDVLVKMDEGGTLRWTKNPSFRCTCGIDRVWRTLSILPKEDLVGIVEQEESVSIKCEFCGSEYSVTKQEIRERLLDGAKTD